MSTAQIVSINPAAPDAVIATFPASGGIDVDRAVTAGRAALEGWRRSPAQVRSDALLRAATAVDQAAAELTDLCVAEVGKPVVEARGEVARTSAILRFHAAAALDPDGETYPPSDGRSLVMARRRPRGVIGLITPWNFPLAIPAWKFAPALAYGNVAVWKPSEHSPACAQRLHQIVSAELPAGVLQLVQGFGDAGGALTTHAGISALSFTGSERTGRRVAAAMTERGAPFQCEMGGQNASIVLPDADLEVAAAAVAASAMGYAGQKCTATSRILCEPGNAAAVREAVVAAVEKMGLEDPTSTGCQVGPVISREAREAALQAVERATAAGAKVLTGGAAAGDDGWYVRPTVVAIDDPAAELAQEEVFAPVCAILEVASDEAAATVTAGVRHGLVTSVFTRDLDRALALCDSIDTGLVRVNLPTSGVDFHAPFGGEKASGLGPREQGKAAREFYTSWRTISLAPSR